MGPSQAAGSQLTDLLGRRQHRHTGVNVLMSHAVTIWNMCIGTYLGEMVMFSVINDTVGLCAVLRGSTVRLNGAEDARPGQSHLIR